MDRQKAVPITRASSLEFSFHPLGRYRYAKSDVEDAGTGWMAEPPDHGGIPVYDQL